ncbi:MAG: histidinol dehydrogenase, partial [Halobacteriales archaeon]
MQRQSLSTLDPDRKAALIERDAGIDALRDDVREIIDRVRTDGDAALRSFSAEFDDVTIEDFDITAHAAAAVDRLDATMLEAIHTAAENIRAFHERQRPTDWRETFDERELGRRFRPIERVGVYAPGGTAAYPSSALMGIIPATVAGVEEIVAVTPPAEEINPVTLAAIDIAGADTVYQIGGAQAIAALAYGTESIRSVEKIVGPGNAWVTAAKTEVQGDVAIDFAAGPSEILVIADETADPAYVAADLVAQAEHDPNA